MRESCAGMMVAAFAFASVLCSCVLGFVYRAGYRFGFNAGRDAARAVLRRIIDAETVRAYLQKTAPELLRMLEHETDGAPW